MKTIALARQSFSVLLLAPLAAAADLFVDDTPGTGAPYATIQAAIDAAQQGDHVRVRTGTYPGFTIDGKWLVVVEEPGASVVVDGRAILRNVPADRGLQILGLSFLPASTVAGSTVEIGPNAGPVTLDDCVVHGRNAANPGIAVQALSTPLLLLRHCTLLGGSGTYAWMPQPGAPALQVAQTRVELHECFATGGRGGTNNDGSDDDYSGASGGPGVRLVASPGFAVRSAIQGGAGGSSSSDLFQQYCAGNGGAGVALEGSTIEHVLSTVTGGQAGYDQGWTPHCNGVAGPAFSSPGAATPTDRNPICFGLYSTCPCGNEGHGGAGCENSFSRGARLEALGTASLAQDALTLTVTGVGPTAPVLFFQGTALQASGSGTVLGDGLRCAGGAVLRLGSRDAVESSASFGSSAGDPPLSVLGQIAAPGGTRVYQSWYRNSVDFCTLATSNLTNAFEVRWSN